MLLKVGRHLRPASHYKLIISREEGENHYLTGYQHEYTTILTVSHGGPVTLIDGTPTQDDLLVAARIVARYSQGRDADNVTLSINPPGEEGREVTVQPFTAAEVPESWHV